MVRSLLALTTMLAPVVLFGTVQGCGDEPLPQDLCNWLADSNNCYGRFGADINTQCGGEAVLGDDPIANATGSFASRDELEICVKNAGGQVLFEDAPDLAAFPLTTLKVKFLDLNATECGNIEMSGGQSFTITVQPVDKNEPGASTNPDGSPLSDSIVGGTFTSTRDLESEGLDVSCPGGSESHNFNVLLLEKCRQFSPMVPRMVIDSSPGVPETQAGPAVPGFIRLRAAYPPADPNAAGATPRIVEYFNCLIPPPPPPCRNGVQDGNETAIDCGGGCPARCAEGQSCVENADCQTDNCGFAQGLRQCLAPPA